MAWRGGPSSLLLICINFDECIGSMHVIIALRIDMLMGGADGGGGGPPLLRY